MDDFGHDIREPRTVAVQVDGDPREFAGVGADRAWVGVRGCPELFLKLCDDGTIRRWLRDAARVGRTVGLSTPFVVPGALFARVVSAITDHADAFDRVMTGDIGVAAAVAPDIAVTWCGRVLNVAHAEYLRGIGVDSVRALSPVSVGCRDINHTVDLEMPAFGRIPLAFSPVCHYRMLDPGFACPDTCAAGRGGQGAAGHAVELTCEQGGLLVGPCLVLSRDFLDLSPVMKPFGRDTCAVVETSDLTRDEVGHAVDALRHGELVPTSRPLFVSEVPDRPLNSGW